MATQTAPKPEPLHPPLARDAQGNVIAIPDGTAAWRICRQTTGRPKEILGPDKRTLRFPLETTPDDLAATCGEDVYRVYALDEVGNVLDYVGTVDVAREALAERNAETGLTVPRAAPSSPTTDLRFALEAMTQMMRVNSEALRAVTETQADCVKAIVSVRGFFRNAQPSLAVDAPRETTPLEDDDDDAGDDGDGSSPGRTIYDVLAPIAEQFAPILVTGAAAKLLGSGAGSRPSSNDADLAAKPNWEIRELIDLKYAAAKAEAKKAAKQAAAPKPSLQARVMGSPKLMAQFMAIKEQLKPEEIAQLFAFGQQLSDVEQELLLSKIESLQPQEAATLLRAMLTELVSQPSTDHAAK